MKFIVYYFGGLSQMVYGPIISTSIPYSDVWIKRRKKQTKWRHSSLLSLTQLKMDETTSNYRNKQILRNMRNILQCDKILWLTFVIILISFSVSVLTHSCCIRIVLLFFYLNNNEGKNLYNSIPMYNVYSLCE